MVQRELRVLAIGLRAEGMSWDMNRLIQRAQGRASSTSDRGELQFLVCAATQQYRGNEAKRNYGRKASEAHQSS
jgi:hypothetical protein